MALISQGSLARRGLIEEFHYLYANIYENFMLSILFLVKEPKKEAAEMRFTGCCEQLGWYACCFHRGNPDNREPAIALGWVK